MAKIIFSAQHWLQRAEQARTLAQTLRSPECKHIMQEVAQTYKYLAGLSEHWHRFAKETEQEYLFSRAAPPLEGGCVVIRWPCARRGPTSAKRSILPGRILVKKNEVT